MAVKQDLWNKYGVTYNGKTSEDNSMRRKNVGLLPKTDYNWNTYVGGSNAQLSAMQFSGLNPLNNGQKSAPVINGNPGLKGVPGGTNWEAAYKTMLSNWKPTGGGGGGSYGGGRLGHIGAFAPSDSYNQAMAYTNQLLEKLNSGRTSYSDRIDSLMNTIANRDKFSYDFNTDPLFQNALASAMQSGQTAMQDTIGQASALTGGYGSSYATSAANQAYNSFIQDAYSDLPQYYNMALQAYEMEGNELYNQLGMWRDADDSEYNRLYNAYNMNYGQAQDMYNKEYSNYWDTANYNLGVDQYNNDMTYKYASLNESARQHNQSMAYNQYKDSLAAYEKLISNKNANNNDIVYEKASASVKSAALKAYNEGGDAYLDRYIESLPSNIDMDDLAAYVYKYGRDPIYDKMAEKGKKQLSGIIK